jgi:hypothetical protein
MPWEENCAMDQRLRFAPPASGASAVPMRRCASMIVAAEAGPAGRLCAATIMETKGWAGRGGQCLRVTAWMTRIDAVMTRPI